MFFYISFLRPPPLQSALSATIPITPQIANDLRTEHFDGSQDIYYSWSPFPSLSSMTTIHYEQPIKLTTWRQSNAYKEIPVPPPHGVREGQKWRLLLTADALAHNSRSSPVAINLNHKNVGKTPFPVMSMPILFTSRAPPKGAKQEQIERVYHLRPVTKGSDRLDGGVSLRLVEQTSFDLDKVCSVVPVAVRWMGRWNDV